MGRRNLFALIFLCAACDGGTAAPTGNSDLAITMDGALGGDASSNVDGGSSDAAQLAPVKFKITFDYRFDTAGFFTAERRATLEGAARIWGRLLQDDFGTVPAGTALKIRDPEHPGVMAMPVTSNVDIEDLLVFVGSSAIDGESGTLAMSSPTAGINDVADDTLRQSLSSRTFGADFEPWTAWISFDRDEDFYFDPAPDTSLNVPIGKTDFATVAIHELGHCLGFGTSDAFSAHVAGGQFTGPATSAVFGSAVALSGDNRHIGQSVVFQGKKPLMDVSDSAGQRQLPSGLDLAMLADIGYQR